MLGHRHRERSTCLRLPVPFASMEPDAEVGPSGRKELFPMTDHIQSAVPDSQFAIPNSPLASRLLRLSAPFGKGGGEYLASCRRAGDLRQARVVCLVGNPSR